MCIKSHQIIQAARASNHHTTHNINTTRTPNHRMQLVYQISTVGLSNPNNACIKSSQHMHQITATRMKSTPHAHQIITINTCIKSPQDLHLVNIIVGNYNFAMCPNRLCSKFRRYCACIECQLQTPHLFLLLPHPPNKVW